RADPTAIGPAPEVTSAGRTIANKVPAGADGRLWPEPFVINLDQSVEERFGRQGAFVDDHAERFRREVDLRAGDDLELLGQVFRTRATGRLCNTLDQTLEPRLGFS